MFYAVIYLFDQFLSLLVGVGAIGLAVLLLTRATPNKLLAHCNNQSIKPLPNSLIWGLLVFCLWSIVATYQSGCGFNPKTLGSLALIAVLTLCWRNFRLVQIVVDSKLSTIIISCSAIFLLLQLLGWGFLSAHWVFNKPSGLYTEPSHLAIYLLPLIAYRLFKKMNDPLAIAMALFIILFFNSATFSVGVILLSSISYLRVVAQSKKRALFILLGVLILVAMSVAHDVGLFNISVLIERIHAIIEALPLDDPSGIMNASAIVWLNGWSQAYETFLATNGLGVGWNNMGCAHFYEVGRFSNHIALWIGAVLNWNDGSFLASKLIAELGILGIGIVLFLVIFAVGQILRYIGVSNIDPVALNVYTLRASGALMILILLFVRANGYFMLPVLLAIGLLFFPDHAKREIA